MFFTDSSKSKHKLVNRVKNQIGNISSNKQRMKIFVSGDMGLMHLWVVGVSAMV